MKKNRVFMFAAAVAALLLAACDKEQQGYDSFILDIAGFSGADGSKAYWNDQGFWWENNTDPDGGDVVRINGDVHNIYRDDTLWKTHADAATNPIGGNYYIAYAGDGDNTRGMVWDPDRKLYGPVEFDGTIVPLARSGSGNRMTLNPCCAVFRFASGSIWDPITFYSDENFEEPGTVNGKILASGSIDPATSSLVSEVEIDYGNGISTPITGVDGVYDYYVIPIEGKSVTAYIKIGEKQTGEAQTIRKGVLYTFSL